jgi:glyoxylase I family protein
LVFDIEPELFDVIRENNLVIAHGPVTRSTGRDVYFYDPDGFIIDIRCDPH